MPKHHLFVGESIKKAKKVFRHFAHNFYVVGLLSLGWLIFRSGTKPDRLKYPCQKAALANSVVLLGTVSSSSILGKITHNKSFVLISFVVLALVLVGGVGKYINSLLFRWEIIGWVQGQSLSRVVKIEHSEASNWNFNTRYYWQYVDQSVVNHMLDEGLKALTGAATPQEAWRSVIPYQPSEKVVIKINCNDCWDEPLVPLSYMRLTDPADRPNQIDSLPQVINAVIRGLTGMGIPQSNIMVIEPTEGSNSRRRILYPYYANYINGLYPNVQILDGEDAFLKGYNYCNGTGKVVYSGLAGTDCINDFMVEAHHLINMPIMKAINLDWGITGAIKNHQGSIQNPLYNHVAGVNTSNHPWVDINSNTHIKDKTRLIVADAIFGTWTGIHFDGIESIYNDIPKPWLTFGNRAPNSIFLSTDPVAIDSVMQDFIDAERCSRGLRRLGDPPLRAAASVGLGVYERSEGSCPNLTYTYSAIDFVNINLDAVVPTSTLTPTVTVKQIISSWLTSTLDQNSDSKVNGLDFAVTTSPPVNF